ncbi:MAG: hypothetical protein DRH24_19430 [Deltaproteobacteria bacterium]|nr:MAG: hypothetical protein DRH24_19430 [Deltaproteobacteria bacterium]
MSKAQLSLEYIVKVLILLVVVAVVIGMIIKFSDRIKYWVYELFRKDEQTTEFPKRVTQDSFSSGEIATYIESCLLTMSSLPEEEQEDIDCYILTVNQNFIASPDEVIARLSPETAQKTEIQTDFSRDLVIIQYQDIGNKVIVID